ncbi:MAG: hypothetical protein H6667_11875 [Ardenticatenaceae bacterium]|nr:hypothetical protein [Ardenticatenaceae bacterium]MCB9442900.1 hypothetical protein [Ardenticatenaceae bacterium]
MRQAKYQLTMSPARTPIASPESGERPLAKGTSKIDWPFADPRAAPEGDEINGNGNSNGRFPTDSTSKSG